MAKLNVTVKTKPPLSALEADVKSVVVKVGRTPAGARGAAGRDGIDGKDGIDGIDGVDGKDGDSAYQIAIDNGFLGTEAEWLASLKGADGQDGAGGGGDMTLDDGRLIKQRLLTQDINGKMKIDILHGIDSNNIIAIDTLIKRVGWFSSNHLPSQKSNVDDFSTIETNGQITVKFYSPATSLFRGTVYVLITYLA